MALFQKKENTTADNLPANEEAADSIGSRIVLAFVTLLIIVIWLAILALLVKFDVGGFGSTVLRPIIKDVPYLNLILPEEDPVEDPAHQYETIEDAIARIKELEALLDNSLAQGQVDEALIKELQETIAALTVYKEQQDAFEKNKQKWYEEVIFGTENVDYEWYKTYYESIDPENAEVLYKQVVEQWAYDQKMQEYVNTYSVMKAKEAAAIFDEMMGNQSQLIADILMNMNTQSRADILAAMDEKNAAKLTSIMEPDK